jgi:hypothetical protein
MNLKKSRNFVAKNLLQIHAECGIRLFHIFSKYKKESSVADPDPSDPYVFGIY